MLPLIFFNILFRISQAAVVEASSSVTYFRVVHYQLIILKRLRGIVF